MGSYGLEQPHPTPPEEGNHPTPLGRGYSFGRAAALSMSGPFLISLFRFEKSMTVLPLIASPGWTA